MVASSQMSEDYDVPQQIATNFLERVYSPIFALTLVAWGQISTGRGG